MSTLLITGCGGNHFLETLPCFKPHRIIGVASELDQSLNNMVDAYEKVSRCDAPEYIKQLIDNCKKYKVDILIPTLDAEMITLCKNKERFLNIGVKVAVSNKESIETVTDKSKFSIFLEQSGLPYAKYQIITSDEELEEKAHELGYPTSPVCMKLVDKGGSRGFRIIDENHDFYSDYANNKPSSRFITMETAHRILKGRRVKILLQEYLSGDEYSTDMVCDNGTVIAIAGRKNTVVCNSIPLESIVEKDDGAYKISCEIAKKLKLDGNIGIDFIKNKNGKYIPIETNARITATVGLFARAGLNLPLLQVQRMLEEKYDVPNVTYGVRMKKQYRAIYGGVDNG